ncbi:MBL fold metallo-hydrolase [Erythrobacter insulae]|uniref:MBL fold metallo-hydrolase n=1 Tax=Erythrobacter insulae TaxID=2584124 RepID=A0A547PAI0_9SPHN|nr:MBL fold metallo-hydrolase [Erythrobacter insulae]TRD11145.1 MBL fold metallo-hydrolase [Erythrobacter insulae]
MRAAARFAYAVCAAAVLAACGSSDAADPSAVPPGITSPPRAEQPAGCPGTGAALQVLGSGGPIAEADRAGTSYLLWIDGEPRLLIDAGAGSFLRYAQAGGKLATLDAIVLTHLHADHAGDLAGILNSGGFEGRSKPLFVAGPDAAPRFPGMETFITRLLGKDAGAFAYNGGYTDGTENKPALAVQEITTAQGTGAPAGLDVSNDFSVMAHPVHHGVVPALGYVIDVAGKSIVITGDQSAQSERFLNDLTGSKPAILIAHHVINGDDGQPRGLHRTPEQIGALAGALEPGRLVLSHNMERSLNPITASLEAIGRAYSGPVSVAFDLDCYAL